MEEAKFTGVVKVYHPLKGYGFITREKGRDVFFHRSALKTDGVPLEGARVRFAIEVSDKGPQAQTIERIG